MRVVRTPLLWFAIAAWLSAGVSLSGCAKSPAQAEPKPAAASAETSELPAPPAAGQQAPAKHAAAERGANDILAQLLTTYREAKTYRDRAVVRLAFRQGGQPVAEEWPTAVAFERPNKISIAAYQAVVKCDGREFKARIEDPATNHVDRQVVVRPAPQELKLVDLASDTLLHDILSSRLRRQPIQLELLLESSGLVSAFKADVVCERLPDERHGGRECFRVAVPSPGGPFTFWVDRQDFLLRRLDYPAAALAPELASDPSISELSILADLREAKLNEPLPAAEFALDVPPDARRMKTFVVPPRPLPSELFGQEPRAFYFTDLSGDKVASDDLRGSLAVLVWYHDNPACEATLQQVSAARQRLSDDSAVRFYAVATDPTTKGSDDLRQRLAAWSVDLPLVRDLEAFGDKSFHIELQPTVVVLDKQGRVQIFQTGGSPELADQLVAIVERLKRGENLAEEIVARHEREQREYEQLVARGGPEPGEVVELPEAVIRRASQPTKFRIEQAWTMGELHAPGNVLVVEEPGRPARVFVIEGWRSVAELDASGKLVARHALDLPPQAAITFLRTAVGADGKRVFVAAAPLATQLYVFDDAFRPLVAFPPPNQAPLHIIDAALADVGEKDGQPEILVASVGDVGLVALSPSGDVTWRNRTFANALSCAAVTDDTGGLAIFVAGEQGTVLRVNRFGHDEPPQSVANWPIGRLIAGPSFSAAARVRLLGLSSNAKGQPFAVGLSDKLKEQWNYPLPLGVHQRPIEPVASSRMLPGYAGEWWLAGPDGSIHLITEDGRLFDSFHVGAPLCGLAAGMLDGRPTIVAATTSGVTAWRVSVPPAAQSREF